MYSVAELCCAYLIEQTFMLMLDFSPNLKLLMYFDDSLLCILLIVVLLITCSIVYFIDLVLSYKFQWYISI